MTEQKPTLLARLLRIPKGMRWVVGVLLLLLIALWAIKARTADSELVFSGGSTVARGYAPVLGIDLRWPEAGPVATDYELGARLIGESSYEGKDQPNQIVLRAALVDGYRWFQAGIGLAYLTNLDRYNGGHVNFNLLVRVVPVDRIRVTYEHVSCAGSCTPNLGRDYVLIGWRF